MNDLDDEISLYEIDPMLTAAERAQNDARVKAGRAALPRLRNDWRVRGEWLEYDRHGRQHLLVAAQHKRVGCLRCLRYNADGQQWQQQSQDSSKNATWTRID